MAVTITTTSNQALNTDLLLSGTINISGALVDGTETLNVSLYNNTTGANFNGTAQTYDGASTVTYNYANGTTLSVNYATGAWVYGRLSTDVGSTNYSYIFTFDFTDSSGTSSFTETVTTIQNVTINNFSVNSPDDLDAQITGVCDVSIVNLNAETINMSITNGQLSLSGVAQPIVVGQNTYTWNYVDGSSMVVDLATKSFIYTRSSNDVGDSTVNTYSFSLVVGDQTSYVYATSVVGMPPSITNFDATSALDTDAKITGSLIISNPTNSTISVNLNHDGVSYSGSQKNYVANSLLTWNFADGSVFAYDSGKNTYSYTRVAGDTSNLVVDKYVFTVNLSNKYGTDSATVTLTTSIPKASIIAFSADNIMDDKTTIDGVLKFNLPSLSVSPTMKIDVTVNGATFTETAKNIGTNSITFNYSNGSKLVVDISTQSFVYTRASSDTATTSVDTYIFDCTIKVNGQETNQTVSVKSLAGVRNYDYEPAYPVQFTAGSTESQNTAWPKSIEETKRVYRLLNENMNYYESMYQALNTSLESLTTYVEKMNTKLESIFDDKGRLVYPNGNKLWIE